ncbi:MAG: N-acetyltransferase [Candidatus Nealsonbacteria bacterium]
MATKLTIRPVAPQDISRILEIEKDCFPQGAYSKTRLEKLSRKHGRDFMVAQLTDQIAGYILAYDKKSVVDFDSLAVAKEYRKLGIGRTLSNFILQKFHKKGLKKASLEVRTSNQGAISLFQDLDFKITRTIKRYYRDGEDAYVMKRSKI